MTNFKHSLVAGAVAMFALCAAGTAMAQDIIHNQENANSPFASSVIVPPGYTTYYISGSGPAVANASAAQRLDRKLWRHRHPDPHHPGRSQGQDGQARASPLAMWCRRGSIWRRTP